jgi:hypothetical protein
MNDPNANGVRPVDGEISDEDLEQVAGGVAKGGTPTRGPVCEPTKGYGTIDYTTMTSHGGD